MLRLKKRKKKKRKEKNVERTRFEPAQHISIPSTQIRSLTKYPGHRQFVSSICHALSPSDRSPGRFCCFLSWSGTLNASNWGRTSLARLPIAVVFRFIDSRMLSALFKRRIRVEGTGFFHIRRIEIDVDREMTLVSRLSLAKKERKSFFFSIRQSNTLLSTRLFEIPMQRKRARQNTSNRSHFEFELGDI